MVFRLNRISAWDKNAFLKKANDIFLSLVLILTVVNDLASATPGDVVEPKDGQPSIIDSHLFISDFDAALNLARTLSNASDTKEDALRYYKKLYANHPERDDILAEMAPILFEFEQYKEALEILLQLKKRQELNFLQLKMLAICYNIANQPFKALDILTDLRKRDLADPAINDNLVQGYIVATHKLIEDKKYNEAREFVGELYKLEAAKGKIDLAELQTKLGNYRHAQDTLNNIKVDAGNVLRYVNVLLTIGKLDQAEDILRKYDNKDSPNISRALSRTLALMKRHEEQRIIDRSLKFYSSDTNDIAESHQESNTSDSDPLHLWEAGQNYVARRQIEKAMKLFFAALAKDENFEPALFSLSENYATLFDYQRAIDILLHLDQLHPNNRKYLLNLARFQSWSKQFKPALETYKRLRLQNPADPTLIMEMARVASWDKEDRQSYQFYNQLVQHPIKRIRRLAFLEQQGKKHKLQLRKKSAHDIYKKLLRLNPANQEALFDYAELQCEKKEFGLARYAFNQIILQEPNHNLAPSAIEYIDLVTDDKVTFESGYWNESGRGDVSNITHFNNQVGFKRWFGDSISAKNRISGNGNINVIAGHHQYDSGADHDYPGGLDSNSIKLMGNYYLASNTSYEFEIEHQNFDELAPDRTSGYIKSTWSVNDSLDLNLRYQRMNEYANLWAVHKGTASNRYGAGLFARLSRQLTTAIQIDDINYLDYDNLDYQDVDGGSGHNSGKMATFNLGYIAIEHPQTLKFILDLLWRDTHYESVLIREQGRVLDIIHPYWTPQNYTAASMTIEWNHDLSQHLFCSTAKHYYDLRISLGTDSLSNPSIALAATWHHDLMFRNTTLNLSGLTYQSRDWDASLLKVDILYRL